MYSVYGIISCSVEYRFHKCMVYNVLLTDCCPIQLKGEMRKNHRLVSYRLACELYVLLSKNLLNGFTANWNLQSARSRSAHYG